MVLAVAPQVDSREHVKKKVASHPPVESWPQRPVVLQPIYGTQQFCPVNQVFELKSDLFQGRALIRVRSSQPGNADPYFTGRQRKYQFIIQGRFLQEMPVADVVSGGEFFKPLSMRPPKFINKKLQDVLRKRNPGFELDLCSDENPKVWAPFLSAMQKVRADAPGQEPTMASLLVAKDGVEENNQGFGDDYAERITSSKVRRKLLAKAKNNNNYSFSPNFVYTFEGFDEMLDFENYKVDLKIMTFDMLSFLPQGVPFAISAKCKSKDKYLWGWNVWNDRLSQD